MASIIIRGLDLAVKKQLAAQAKENGRSLDAEVREILTAAVQRPHVGLALLQVSRRYAGLVEVSLPPGVNRARAVDFN